ncbi:MAG TPA: hypothetical protein VF062_17665 [Candidatus Limnocylindrales bacterium]
MGPPEGEQIEVDEPSIPKVANSSRLSRSPSHTLFEFGHSPIGRP